MIPANIRFKFYPTPDQVKLENKFAVIPFYLPLVSDMETAYPQIKKATYALKNSISFVYGVYAF